MISIPSHGGGHFMQASVQCLHAQVPIMLNARLLRLDDQTHQHAHDYHQLVMSLSGRAEFEVNGSGGEVCRMRACLVPGDADHGFAGMGDNRMLILDLDEQDTPGEDFVEQLKAIAARLGETSNRALGAIKGFINVIEDARIDKLHRHIFDVVLADTWKENAMFTVDVTLASRYFERFADHVVDISSKVSYLTTGDWADIE